MNQVPVPAKRASLIIVLLISLCQTNLYAQDYPDRFLNGKTRVIQSKILNQDRILFIYLPQFYAESEESYPVHYITDAPATSNMFYGILRLHSLINSVPRSIIVGLSSDGREFNLHPEKGTEKYLEFLIQEVFPFIEENYRTEPFRSISGHSLGGGFAINAFLKCPDMFRLCIAGSPYPLEYLTGMVTSESMLPEFSGKRYLYVSNGSVDDIDKTHFSAFEDAVKTSYLETIESAFIMNIGENHISNIAVNIQDGLEWYYEGWNFELPEKPDLPVSCLLRAHYENLSQKNGYRVRAGEWEVLFPVMDRLAKRGDFASAIEVLNYCIELYPESDQAYAFLAQAHLSTGDKESAKKSVEKALSLNPENRFALRIKGILK